MLSIKDIVETSKSYVTIYSVTQSVVCIHNEFITNHPIECSITD